MRSRWRRRVQEIGSQGSCSFLHHRHIQISFHFAVSLFCTLASGSLAHFSLALMTDDYANTSGLGSLAARLDRSCPVRRQGLSALFRQR